MKKCTKCKIEKELYEFHKCKLRKDGYQFHCKKCISIYTKFNYQKNKTKILKKHKKWRENNVDYHKIYGKKWFQKNKIEIVKKRKERRNNVLLIKLKHRLRGSVNNMIKNKTKNILDMIGCDYITVIDYLNNNEFGFILGDNNIDIDHIIPLSSANSEDELIKLFHYTNLQLLPSYYNRHIKNIKKFNKSNLIEWLNKHNNND